ncbi:MAG: glycosyltransferase [Gaiellales bacterium]
MTDHRDVASSHPTRELPLLWFGPLLHPTGFDEEGHSVLLSLERLGYAPAARNYRQEATHGQSIDAAARGAVERALARPLPTGRHLLVQHALLQGRVHDAGPTAARLMFETDQLPPDWMRRLHTVDELWLTSDHALEVFGNAGVPAERMHLLPMTLDFDLYDPTVEREPFTLPEQARGFRFLTTFEFQERKGWDVLLDAWVRAFDANDDVSLVLKTFSLHGDTRREVHERLDAALAEACRRHGKTNAPVVLESSVLPAGELPRLYAACDAFVLASRGEGWGRPYMEAMAMGLPTIGSGWSGNLAFMDEDNSFLVGGRLRPIERWDARPERDWKGHRWFSADPEHLAETLRAVAAGGAEVERRATNAKNSMRERFAPEVVARRVVELTELALARHEAESGRPVAAVWRGDFGLHHSLAISNLGTSRALEEKLAESGAVLERASVDAAVAVRESAPVGIAQQWPPAWNPPANGPFVLCQPWELSRVPADWVERIDAQVDEVWVPSEHTRRSYVQSGVAAERVHVIGAGVDGSRFTPAGDHYPLPAPAGGHGRAATVFLWVGGLIPRKGLDKLLAAYGAAFTKADDVCLVVKAHQTGGLYRDTTTQRMLETFMQQADAPALVVLLDDIGADELPGLYRAADCVVQPYRAEGFCLPALEALSCGVPVIATAGGPTDEFLSDECAWRIPATELEAPDGWLPSSLATDPERGAPTMLEPDLDALVAALREATDPVARGAKALHARATAERFGWERTGELAGARLEALAGTEPRRNHAQGRKPTSDVMARGAIDDLVTAAQFDVACGLATGAATPAATAGRPGAGGRKHGRTKPQQQSLSLPGIAGGGALAREIERLEASGDDHTRYGIVRESLMRLVAAAPSFPGVRGAGLAIDTILALLDQLERNPSEPLLLSELGISLFGLGELDAAETVFRAIERLDPEYEGVQENLIGVRARRAGSVGGTPLATDPAQRRLARELGRRAEAVATKAAPAADARISLCMIVRDEETMLARSLEAAASWVDEIVVVDTGSTDGTVEVAQAHGARVERFPWTGSFAEARNVSLEAATGDWILWLDADEILAEGAGPKLRELARHTWREGFYVAIENETGDEAGAAVVHEALRFWRNRPAIRFKGRIHEQHTHEMPLELAERFGRSSIRVRHLGYRPEIVAAKGKSKRNRTILEQERPGPFTWFSLASEHFADEEHAEAFELFDRAWHEIDREVAAGASEPHYRPVLALRRARTARLSSGPQLGLELAAEGLETYPLHTDLVLESAICAKDLGYLDEAARLAEEALKLGDGPARYAAQVGCGTFLALEFLATVRAAQGRLDEATDLLERCRQLYPESAPSVDRRLASLGDVETAQRNLIAAIENHDPAALAGALAACGDRLASDTLSAYLSVHAVLTGDGDVVIPIDVTPALSTLLDELLAAQRFAAFEVVLRAWEASALETGDRDDILARIYLGRGFVDSAAELWARAWDDRKDTRAVVGFARIHARQGDNEAARELAAEALELDPELAEAQELLAVLA